MKTTPDPALESLFGSRTRLLTMAVLANADEPLTGYRVAKIANLPREKVYPEIRRGIEAGLIERREVGFRLCDLDVRTLLRKRVRIRWDEEWDRSRTTWAGTVMDELSRIRASLKGTRIYDPSHRIPAAALRELERDPKKNRILRDLRLRAATRKE